MSVVSEVMTTKGANGALASSGFLAGVTWIADLAVYLQIGATIVAIVAGAAAAWYHVERALRLRKERQNEQNNGRAN